MAARHILQFVHTCKLFKDFTINYSMGGKIIALTDYTDLNVSQHTQKSPNGFTTSNSVTTSFSLRSVAIYISVLSLSL